MGNVLGVVDPKYLMALFLTTTVLNTTCKPVILRRIGLQRTVLFGALVLMLRNMVKSSVGTLETDQSDYGN